MTSPDLEVKYGLPRDVKFCKRCVMSNQRPSSAVEFAHHAGSKKQTIGFSESGICEACLYAEKKDREIDWKERERDLLAVLEKYRSKDGSYDCLVPGSGGKDSIYAAHLLKYKYGMNPLTVTWAPHIYTDVGWRNFQSWINSGFDNVLFTPNGKVHRLLTKLAFENLLHPFQPFILGQKNLAPKIAAKYNIELVFYGENEAEYGNPLAENKSAMREGKYFSAKDYDKIFLGGTSVQELKEKHKLKNCDLENYLPADPQVLIDRKIQVHYLGYYVKWVPQEAYYFSVENSGFEANTERTEGTYSKYNSIDDKTDGFHYYTTYIKFGIGRATYDAAQEIRNQHITRDEGVALVKRFDGEFPKKYFHEFLDYVDLREEQFYEICDAYRSPHLWVKQDGKWVLRHQVE